MDPTIEKLLDDLGIPTDGGDLIDGEPAIAVDTERLRAFFRNELKTAEAEEVADLIAHYRAWHDASLSVMKEEF